MSILELLFDANASAMRTRVIGKEKERTKVEKIESIVLRLTGIRLGVRFGVTTPDNKDAADEGTGVSDTGRWYLAAGLKKSSGDIAGGEDVEVVADSIAHEAAEKE